MRQMTFPASAELGLNALGAKVLNLRSADGPKVLCRRFAVEGDKSRFPPA
jgi:hypothetical protein